MGVNRTPFGSKSERENFYKLSRSWKEPYRLYHNLPFLNVVNLDNVTDLSSDPLVPLEIDEVDRSRLKKTSIDFVLCDENDHPLVGIDFDGMQAGLNDGTTYTGAQSKNEWRTIITELKLRVAHGSDFPYFVMSSNEFRDLAPNLRFTLADGIIGRVLANQIGRTIVIEGPSVQDAILASTTAEIELNPLSKERLRLWGDLGCPAIVSFHGARMPQAVVDGFPGLAGYKDAFPDGIPEGCTVILVDTEIGCVWVNVRLHEFKTPGYRIGLLDEEVGSLLVLAKLQRYRAARDSK